MGSLTQGFFRSSHRLFQGASCLPLIAWRHELDFPLEEHCSIKVGGIPSCTKEHRQPPAWMQGQCRISIASIASRIACVYPLLLRREFSHWGLWHAARRRGSERDI